MATAVALLGLTFLTGVAASFRKFASPALERKDRGEVQVDEDAWTVPGPARATYEQQLAPGK